MAEKMNSMRVVLCIAVFMLLSYVNVSCVSLHKNKTMNEESVISLDRPLGSEGTVSFKMTVPQTYRVGADSPKKDIPILEIPGLVSYRLHQSDPEPHDPNVIKLSWRWQQDDTGAIDFVRYVPEVPGPQSYYVQYTWDTERGIIDAYIDGNPIRIPGEQMDSWSMEAVGDKIVLPASEIKVSGLEVKHHHLPPWRAQALVPDEYRGRSPELWGLREDAEALDVSDRKGDLLYSVDLDEQSDIADWPEMEGPGKVAFEDGWMRMWSPGKEGHHVLWCPEDFPDSFVAEWDIKLESRKGLCIIFFAAKGKNGEDILAPSMPARDGDNFGDYTMGAIQAYHISYFASPNRITSNMRKDGQFYLMDQGPIAILPGPQIHHVRLIKDEGHIQLQVDGEVYIDYTDNNEARFGPRYRDGKIGFRQMYETEGLYRNFRVWKLQDEK